MQTKLADYLAATGRTQTEIAEQLGVSRQAVSQYLLGDTLPTLDHALKMRDLFGISVDSWRRPAKPKGRREAGSTRGGP